MAEGGAIQFEIKAAVLLDDGQFLRAGYSATAGVVLDERKQVLAVSERLVQYDRNQPFVDVLVGDNVYERRDLSVGLSDGLMTEVLSGLTKDDAIKIWNNPGTNDLPRGQASHGAAGCRGQGLRQRGCGAPGMGRSVDRGGFPS